MVTDIDKRKLKKVVKSQETVVRRIWKLKETNMKTRFQERVKELVDVDTPNLYMMVCYKLVMKYVERRKIEEIMGTHGGGTRSEGSNTTKGSGI